MDKLTKLLSKVIGDEPPAPPAPSVQQQNLPSITTQAPAPSSSIPAPALPAPPGSSTRPVYGPASGSARPSPQEQFFEAVRKGQYEKVNQALSLKPLQIDISQLEPTSGMSALRIALDAKNDALAQLLIAQGHAPVNAETKAGNTPLMLAVRSDLLKTSKSLLRRGAEVNDQDIFRKTALHHGCDNENENVELIQALLDAGADKNKADTLGATPLALACNKGHAGIVKLLLERGAAVNRPGKGMDYTPLLEACKATDAKASAEIIDLLLAKGASVDCCSERGDTPFMVAIEFQNSAALEALVASLGDDAAAVTAYLNKPNNKGMTAWKVVTHPDYDRSALGYGPGYAQRIDDIKSLLVKYRADH